MLGERGGPVLSGFVFLNGDKDAGCGRALLGDPDSRVQGSAITALARGALRAAAALEARLRAILGS